jgi:IS5 family transposase
VVATTLFRSKGGQFVGHEKALPGNPYDGYTLAVLLPEMEKQIGASIARVVADRGYRGHNAPPTHKFRMFISGQRRRVTEAIKRELRRRSAVEPVIGHLKAEHRMAATTSPIGKATPPTPSSPPQDTTSDACWPG